MIMLAIRLAAVIVCAGVIYGLGSLNAGAGDAGQPMLRTQVTVAGDYVTLGDLFDNAGAATAIRVFRAPDPGETGTVNAARVEQAARANGLLWNAAGGPLEVSVSRASTEVPLDAIVALIEGAVREKLGLDADAELTIALDADARPMHLPADLDGTISARRTDVFANGTFAVEIETGLANTLIYRGQATESISLPVLARDVARGETLSSGDIELKRFARNRINTRDLITSSAEVIAKAARRTLRAGASLRIGDIEEPKLVRRGDLVTIQFSSPGLLLSVRGKALADGTLNEEIAVVNTQSNRVIEAAVVGMGQVSVVPVTAPIANRTAAAAPPAPR